MKIILKILTVVGLFILLASSFTLLALAESSIKENVYLDSDGVRLSPGRIGMLTVITEVNTFNDDQINNGNCTLREAIQAANNDAVVDQCPAGSGEDTIILLAGTYDLTDTTNGDLDITSNLTILGVEAASTIIDGSSNSDRVFDISSTAVVTISGVTIRNGGGAGVSRGGGILNQGTLVLSDTIVTGNTANWDGGGIYNQNTLTIISSTISSNKANEGEAASRGVGGGIANSADDNPGSNATLIVSQSRIVNNTVYGVGGGGLSNTADNDRTATATLSQTIVSGNVATATSVISTAGFGGGIRNSYTQDGNSNSNAILSVYNSTIEDNKAFNGGGIGNGTLTDKNILSVYLENSTVSGNTASNYGDNSDLVGNGGGLVNQNGTTTLINSTVSGNTADGGSGQVSGLGGGVFNADFTHPTTLWLTNTTVASNTATNGGDGVANVGGLSSTVTNFNNTIIADSCSSTINPILSGTSSGTFASQGYNLGIDGTCGVTDGVNNDIVNSNPSLGLLRDNGGNTETHALSANSPAIDTGDCVLPKDQRGQDRPNSVTLFCDIGAYESSFAGLVDLEMTKTVTPTEVTAGDTITYTLTFTNNGLAPVTGVVITDIVPTELTDLTVSNSGTAIVATPGYTYSWAVADLWRGDGGVITITGQVISGTASGPLANTAMITTTNLNPDSDIDNNDSEATVTVGGSGSGGPGPVFLPIILKNASS